MTNGYHADGNGMLDKRQAEEKANSDQTEMGIASSEEGRKAADWQIDGEIIKERKIAAGE